MMSDLLFHKEAGFLQCNNCIPDSCKKSVYFSELLYRGKENGLVFTDFVVGGLQLLLLHKLFHTDGL